MTSELRNVINFYSRREPRLVTHVRRFVRRAEAHRVTVDAVIWSKTHALVRIGKRAVRVDDTGDLIQSAAFADSQAATSHHGRIHALYLSLARSHRLGGRLRQAVMALATCERVRDTGAPLPS